MILIDYETTENLQSPLDIERFTRRYKTTNNYFMFPSPSLEVVDRNLFFLLRNSIEKDFDAKYRFRPDYLSFDEYGTPLLWQMLMYVNSVFSVEDFDLSKVLVPSFQSVTEILPNLIPEQEVDEVQQVNW